MIRKLLFGALVLLFLTVDAMSQPTAQGLTVTCQPDARQQSFAFVPGAVIRCYGRIFDSTPDPYSKGQIQVNLFNPPPESTKNLRINYVGRTEMSFSINVPSMTGSPGFFMQGFGISELIVLPDAPPGTPANAAPQITATGAYASLQFPVSQSFNGTITFGPLVSIIRLGLIGFDFGSIPDWIVRFEGPITVEVLAHAVVPGQGQSPYLNFDPGLGRLPAGTYFVTARAQDQPSIASNTVTILVE